MICYARAASDLGPDYYCPLCVRDEKDLARGCPTCRLTDLLNFHKDEIEREVKLRLGTWPRRWPLAKLLALHAQVSRALSLNKNCISRKGPVIMIELASILKQERNQDQAIELYNIRQERKWETKSK
jgi:hypothetical protein